MRVLTISINWNVFLSMTKLWSMIVNQIGNLGIGLYKLCALTTFKLLYETRVHLVVTHLNIWQLLGELGCWHNKITFIQIIFILVMLRHNCIKWLSKYSISVKSMNFDNVKYKNWGVVWNQYFYPNLLIVHIHFPMLLTYFGSLIKWKSVWDYEFWSIAIMI